MVLTITKPPLQMGSIIMGFYCIRSCDLHFFKGVPLLTVLVFLLVFSFLFFNSYGTFALV